MDEDTKQFGEIVDRINHQAIDICNRLLEMCRGEDAPHLWEFTELADEWEGRKNGPEENS